MSEKGVEYKVKELHKQIKTNGVSLLKYPLQNNVESKPIESNELNDLRFKKQLEDLGVSA